MIGDEITIVEVDQPRRWSVRVHGKFKGWLIQSASSGPIHADEQLIEALGGPFTHDGSISAALGKIKSKLDGPPPLPGINSFGEAHALISQLHVRLWKLENKR